jgi:hypothetical protein
VTLSTPKERELAAAARVRWEEAFAAARTAASLPPGLYGDSLDPFHDELDKAVSLLADLNSLNVNQVALEISSLRDREQLQLLASLATLIVGFVAGGLLSRRVYRSITVPLHSLEGAAIRFRLGRPVVPDPRERRRRARACGHRLQLHGRQVAREQG